MASSPILIAVLGVTGAGKTTFISKCTGRNDLKIGYGLESCKSRLATSKLCSLLYSIAGTKELSLSEIVLDGKAVTLIDTPGFDDTERTDADILEMIAEWLKTTYDRGILLTGVILLQSITGNRVQGSERRRTRLFEKVCGPDAMGHVIIATTMWSELQSEQAGVSRMNQRMISNDFWGSMVSHGAKVFRHENAQWSAQTIVRALMHKSRIPLQMQEELQRTDGRLSETSAGQQLNTDLSESSKKVLDQLEKLLVNERQNNVSLREEVKELRGKLEDLLAQQSKLQNTRVSPDFHLCQTSRRDAKSLES